MPQSTKNTKSLLFRPDALYTSFTVVQHLSMYIREHVAHPHPAHDLFPLYPLSLPFADQIEDRRLKRTNSRTHVHGLKLFFICTVIIAVTSTILHFL